MVENGEGFNKGCAIMVEIREFHNKSDFYSSALDFIVKTIEEVLGKKELFTLSLAGGNTPIPLYEMLAEFDLPWNKIHLFWGDERFLPPNNESSNFRMVYDKLLSKIDIPDENIHRFKTELLSIEEVAEDYERELLEFFRGFPSFDLMLLGMGEDGHTASIFPKSKTMNVKDKLVATVEPTGKPKVARVTMTLKVLNNSKIVVFLISGERKRKILKEIIENPERAKGYYPVAFVQGKEKTVWFVNH